ncbi:MAG: dTDP-4-dehydrorhamnose reductase [Acidiferrobacterales bacterium]
MRILVVGALGQVGHALVASATNLGLQVLAVDHKQLDITKSTAVQDYVRAQTPDIVINAAAYTAVDKAETEPQQALAVNAHGPGNLAAACLQQQIPLIQLSTDYVFDGTLGRPYCEDDAAAPLNVYGKSKWQGERAVRQVTDQHIIMRVSGVFGPHGSNFVKTILRLAGERDQLRVVADQATCPTSAQDIADVIISMVRRIADTDPVPWGTYHYCGTPATTWYGFASAILEIASQQQSLMAKTVTAITTEEFPTAARRPANSVLDCSRLEQALNIQRHSWKESLPAVIHELQK